jgi:2-polyprenyl-3-methyl-5-hydroxy-6-metoxy-1,4-benzoquinol methylase
VSEAAATFWNQRYRDHSACWGEDGSPTLQLALKHFPAAGHALEIGYGYGRDLVTLARRGLVVTGIDPSGEGQHMAEARLAALGVKMVTLLTADFTEARLPERAFDAVLSHGTLHLMTEPGAAGRFADRLAAVTKPGAVVCIGTRDLRDLDPARMNGHHHGDDVYEYSDRPGHVISYWDDERFHMTFAADFDIVALEQASELEASDNPVPCYLTIMVARRRPAGEAPP